MDTHLPAHDDRTPTRDPSPPGDAARRADTAPPGDVVVFIDAAYLLTALSSHHNATMSRTIFNSPGIAAHVGKVVAARLGATFNPDGAPLEADRVQLRWYDSVDPSRRVETPWVAAVRNDPGVVVRLGRTTTRDDHRLEQKRVDTLLVADLIEAVYAADPPSDVVVVSGDEDLTPAVDVAARRGARTHVLGLTVDGARHRLSHHLRLSVTGEIAVDITELAPLARSRSALFAQMAGLLPKKPAKADPQPEPDDGQPDGPGGEGPDETCEEGADEHLDHPGTELDESDTAGVTLVDAKHDREAAHPMRVGSPRQPVLPGMPPDPARWAERVATLPSVTPDDLAVADQATFEERLQAGQVSRAFLAGRAFARRWLGHDPAARAEQVAAILAEHPFLPNSVDKRLMAYASDHVGIGKTAKDNKVEVRAGFSSGIRRLVGLTRPGGLDIALIPAADQPAADQSVPCASVPCEGDGADAVGAGTLLHLSGVSTA